MRRAGRSATLAVEVGGAGAPAESAPAPVMAPGAERAELPSGAKRTAKKVSAARPQPKKAAAAAKGGARKPAGSAAKKAAGKRTGGASKKPRAGGKRVR